MRLRQDQERALAGARASFAEGHRSVLIVGPTGFGKSVLAAAIAKGHIAQGGSVLAVVHRVELVEQLAAKLRAFGLDTGEIRPGAPRVDAPAQVASVQTLIARGQAPGASLMLWDEAHHVLARTWNSLVPATDLLVGLTATPMLASGDGLGAVFSALVVAATRAELRDSGVLVPCEVIAPDRALDSGELAQDPVAAYLEHTPGEQGVLFAPSVEQAQVYADSFVSRGVPAACIWGDMRADERAETLRRFRDGSLRVLTNVAVLTEGFDHPATSVCILARGVGHLGLYDQIVGRVLRAAPGKSRAVLLDLTGATHTCGPPDEERRFALAGRGLRRAADVPEARFCPVCGGIVAEAACDQCGHAGEMRVRPPRVLGLPMQRFAHIRRDDEGARALRLSKWLAHARAKGWREGHAFNRFRAVYGQWPSRALVSRARGMR